MRLFWVMFLLSVFFFALFSSSQASAGSFCKLAPVSKDILLRAEKIRASSKPVQRSRPGKAPVMSQEEVYSMLFAAWKAFGYSNRAAKISSILNLQQISDDSGFRPHIDGSRPGEMNIPYYWETKKDVFGKPIMRGGPPGGLFALYVESFDKWKFTNKEVNADKFNPFYNILATVHMQINRAVVGGNEYGILDGGKWSVKHNVSNPCREQVTIQV